MDSIGYSSRRINFYISFASGIIRGVMLFHHLEDTKMGYFSHMIRAIKFSIKLYCASQILLVHALIPCLFETTASNIMRGILKETNHENT